MVWFSVSTFQRHTRHRVLGESNQLCEAYMSSIHVFIVYLSRVKTLLRKGPLCYKLRKKKKKQEPPYNKGGWHIVYSVTERGRRSRHRWRWKDAVCLSWFRDRLVCNTHMHTRAYTLTSCCIHFSFVDANGELLVFGRLACVCVSHRM